MTLTLTQPVSVKWDAVPGAKSYDILRNGTKVSSTRTSLTARITLASGDDVRVVAQPSGQAQELTLTWASPPPPPPSPPTPPPGVTPPVPPLNDITNPTGLGLNCFGGATAYHDYACTGTYDSAVLLGTPQGGSSFSRFHLYNAASLGTGPGYGRHALYCKAPNVFCVDWYVRMNPQAQDVGSGWSVRFAGFRLDRFDFAGLWFASLFDDDPAHTPGPASFSNGSAAFTAEAAILLDAQIVYAVTLANIAFTGPSGLVATVDAGSKVGAWRATDCTMNGQPVTVGMFRGFPTGSVVLA